MSQLVFFLYLMAVWHILRLNHRVSAANITKSESEYIDSFLGSISARVTFMVDVLNRTYQENNISSCQSHIQSLQKDIHSIILEKILDFPSSMEDLTVNELILEYEGIKRQIHGGGLPYRVEREMRGRIKAAKMLEECRTSTLAEYELSLRKLYRYVEGRIDETKQLYFNKSLICVKEIPFINIKKCLIKVDEELNENMNLIQNGPVVLKTRVNDVKNNVRKMETCLHKFDFSGTKQGRIMPTEENDLHSVSPIMMQPFEKKPSENNAESDIFYKAFKKIEEENELRLFKTKTVEDENVQMEKSEVTKFKNVTKEFEMTENVAVFNKSVENDIERLNGEFTYLRDCMMELNTKIAEVIHDYASFLPFNFVEHSAPYTSALLRMMLPDKYANEIEANQTSIYEKPSNETNCFADLSESAGSLSSFLTYDYEGDIAKISKIHQDINACSELLRNTNNPNLFFNCCSVNEENYTTLLRSTAELARKISSFVRKTIDAFVKEQDKCTDGRVLETAKETRNYIENILKTYIYV